MKPWLERKSPKAPSTYNNQLEWICECGNTQFITDPKRAETICPKCGLIKKQDTINNRVKAKNL